MTRLIYRPIENWPGQRTEQPRPSPFDAKWSATLTLLDHELRMLNVDEAILQIDLPEKDFRLDGERRANSRIRSQAVILSIDAPRIGALSYPCDRYIHRPGTRLEDWQCNVRAIALGLEALRKLDRYGITRHGEQYTGWKQIAAPTPDVTMTAETARRLLADLSGVAYQPGDDWLKTAYRAAAKRVHPDSGGNTATFQRLIEAFELLVEEVRSR